MTHCRWAPVGRLKLVIIARVIAAFGISIRSPFLVMMVVARQRISRMRPTFGAFRSPRLIQSPISKSRSICSASPAMMLPRVSWSARPMTAVVSTEAVNTRVTSTSDRVSTNAAVMK